MRIVLVEQDKIAKYHLGVATVLDVLGQQGALVTDASVIGDFFCLGYDDESEEADCLHKRIELGKLTYGKRVTESSYIWEVGKWIEGE